jgi:cyclopropane fatty-acyl-phospholipid synthase-like methyltransferase
MAPGGSILDLGCGMGEPIARYFIRVGYQVTGVDSSAAMIALCQQPRVPDLPAGENVLRFKRA